MLSPMLPTKEGGLTRSIILRGLTPILSCNPERRSELLDQPRDRLHHVEDRLGLRPIWIQTREQLDAEEHRGDRVRRLARRDAGRDRIRLPDVFERVLHQTDPPIEAVQQCATAN